MIAPNIHKYGNASKNNYFEAPELRKNSQIVSGTTGFDSIKHLAPEPIPNRNSNIKIKSKE